MVKHAFIGYAPLNEIKAVDLLVQSESSALRYVRAKQKCTNEFRRLTSRKNSTRGVPMNQKLMLNSYFRRGETQ
jgi:hypothetical protein